MASVFDRDELVDGIIAGVVAGGVLCGDHVAPKEGGWSTGTPGEGTYTAYAVLYAGLVSVTASTIFTGNYDYRASFDIRCYGASRKQADQLSLQVFEALDRLHPSAWDYRTRVLWRSAVGAVERIDSTSPKGWMVSDRYTADCAPTQ